MQKQRLDRFLSNQLNISRNDIRTGIRRGVCSVNGCVVKDSSFNIEPQNDKVLYKGNEVCYKKYIYIMMNKPSGVITATDDKKQKTVLDILPDQFKRKNLSPVGRLDKDTTGLLILTDDGVFAHRCISPKSNIPKVYIAELDGIVDETVIREFEKGVLLKDGYLCKSAELRALKSNCARVIISEGKYHQIKRMFGVFGLGVVKLHRESIGNLKLPDDLLPGECMELTDYDIKAHFSNVLSIVDKT